MRKWLIVWRENKPKRRKVDNKVDQSQHSFFYWQNHTIESNRLCVNCGSLNKWWTIDTLYTDFTKAFD